MLFKEIEGFAEEVVCMAEKTGSYIDSVIEKFKM